MLETKWKCRTPSVRCWPCRKALLCSPGLKSPCRWAEGVLSTFRILKVTLCSYPCVCLPAACRKPFWFFLDRTPVIPVKCLRGASIPQAQKAQAWAVLPGLAGKKKVIPLSIVGRSQFWSKMAPGSSFNSIYNCRNDLSISQPGVCCGVMCSERWSCWAYFNQGKKMLQPLTSPTARAPVLCGREPEERLPGIVQSPQCAVFIPGRRRCTSSSTWQLCCLFSFFVFGGKLASVTVAFPPFCQGQGFGFVRTRDGKRIPQREQMEEVEGPIHSTTPLNTGVVTAGNTVFP